MLIQLEKSNWWPQETLDQVIAHQDALLSCNFMENLIKVEPFRTIANELDIFIRKNRLLVYHCTKEPEEGYFQSQGLRILDLDQKQSEFLRRFGARFTSQELAELQEAWSSYFKGAQRTSRNGKIWFCFAPDQVVDESGTKYLFAYFGGEAVSMPIRDGISIAEKLRAIGAPVVVETSVDPNDIHTFSQVPFAINSLSIFHQSVNPEATIHGREGYLSRNVSPSEIVAVTPKDRFFSTHSSNYR